MLVSAMTDWKGRRVLITGHTGFKGSWLSLMLARAGAQVTGFALAPATKPSLFEAADVAADINHRIGDVRDLAAVQAVFDDARPEVVFHLAAQPLVRLSYEQPVETYATNVMGTVHVLEAVRQTGGVKAAVCVTSDKCYENREWGWAYRENDALGGHDPYSNSKAGAELVAAAYRSSFFNTAEEGDAWTGIATARAGNVIGGGDWAQDRLIPDILRALAAGVPARIRAPKAVRPWQHVLEALSGYVLVAERLYAGDRSAAQAWNFGPSDADARPVEQIVEHMVQAWGGTRWALAGGEHPHEAGLLRVDSSKARAELGWQPVMDLPQALDSIIAWHKAVSRGENARDVTLGQIESYLSRSGASAKTLTSKAAA
jgi:CDP-glucose 4,6-dehydratase